MKTSTKKAPVFALGSWVVATNSTGSFKKGMLGVVTSKVKKEEDYFGEDSGYSTCVCFNEEDGNSTYEFANTNDIKATAAPAFAVVWSTKYSDPTMLYQSLAKAKAFVAKLKKRRGENKAAVEIGIYKRQ